MRQVNPHWQKPSLPVVPVPDPAHYWPIEQGSGNIIYDYAPVGPVHCRFNGNNQIWEPPLVAGSTYSIKTSGSGGGARHAQTATLSGLRHKTISFWMTPTDNYNSQIYISTQHLGAPQNGSWYIYSQNGVLIYAYRTGSITKSIVSNPFGASATPMHVTFTHQVQVEGKCYINGADATGSDTTAGGLSYADPGAHVDIAGDSTYSMGALVNKLDELKAWDRVLTPEEAYSLYRSYV